MRLDLYQSETILIAKEHSLLLDEARKLMLASGTLSLLEQKGILHALQVLIENSIGKAKQILKARNENVPVSAYDALAALSQLKVIPEKDLTAWNAVIGLRNRIVHEYMNLDIERVLEFVRDEKDRFITEFLLQPIIE